MVVQHILAVRRVKREIVIGTEGTESKNPETEGLTEVKTESGVESKEDQNVDIAEANAKTLDENKGNKCIEDSSENEIKEEISESLQVDSTTEKDSNETKIEGKTEIVDVEEYFVKYRNFSYLHCEWKTEEELRRGDRRIFSKIKRFQQKMANNVNIFEYVSKV